MNPINNNEHMAIGNRGSEWRRWDLHIHTLNTAKNDQFTSEDFDAFCIDLFKRALEHKIVAIGITDYFSIDNYLRVKSFVDGIGYQEEFSSQEQLRIADIFILPNVELRVVPVTDSGRLVNLHCIFNPSFADRLAEEFFTEIKFSDGGGSRYSMTRQGMVRFGQSLDQGLNTDDEKYMKGVANFVVSHGDLEKLWNHNADLRSNCMVVVSNSSNDGASAFQEHHDLFKNANSGSLDGLRKSIYQLSQMIFSGNPEDRKYFLGHKFDNKDQVISKCGSIKPCIHGSDAHKEEELFLPDQNRFCWIKADPTFEGFKQIVYEPEARIKVQDTNPQADFEKPYFSTLTFSGVIVEGEDLPKFQETTILLNPNMVTIIGGRGTGKSLLLDCLYKLFHHNTNSDERLDSIEPEVFNVEYTKPDHHTERYQYGDEDAQLDYLHVRQGEIKRMATSPEDLSREIKKLLGINTSDTAPDYDVEFSTLIDRIEKALAWFEEKDESGDRINDKERNKKIIQRNQSLIQTITTDENQQNIQSYQKNSREVNSRKATVEKLNDLLTKLTAFKTELNRDIADLNKQDLSGKVVSDISFDITESEVKEIDILLQEHIKTATDSNSEIKEMFERMGVKQDISGLLQKIAQYQREIDLANGRIEDYDSREQSIDDDIAARVLLVNKIEVGLDQQVSNIRERFNSVKDGETSWSGDQKNLVNELLKDIRIDAETVFDAKVFYSGLWNIINGKQFRQTSEKSSEDRLREKFNVKDADDFIRLVRNEPIITSDDDPLALVTLDEFSKQKKYFLKENFNIYQYLYLHKYRKNYLSVQPVIEYLGKAPEKLSVGQRGTFYVCMKLATDPFGSPFVFDQPEDDLDNEFIMKELVPLFRKIKKYRQVIIATHNANLVVNADAEQVIVASNENELLSYRSGSIEYTSRSEPLGIRENICNILEGGPAAFKNRERKYGFNGGRRTQT